MGFENLLKKGRDIVKATAVLGALSGPMAGAQGAELNQNPNADKSELSSKKVVLNRTDLEAGVGETPEDELIKQGHTPEEVDKIMAASAQEDSQLMPEEKVKM